MSVIPAQVLITAVDRASPVFARVAGAAQNAARVYSGAAQTFQQVGTSAAVNFALPAAVGFAALIHRTQEFERALVGVQIAGITDNIGAGGAVNFTRILSDAEKIRQQALQISEALALPPAGILAAGEAAAKMGLSADSLQALMRMGGSIHIQDRTLTPSQAAEFIGSMGILFRAGQTGDDYNADYVGDITRLTNQMLIVANATRTSAGRMQEGLRIFAPLFSSMGEDFATTSALIGAAAQAGQLDIEMGTAYRSLATRMLNPTRQGREAMLLAGIDRSQFMNLDAVSASMALTRLKSLTNVAVGRGAWDQIRALLVEGERTRSFASPEFQQRLAQSYNRITGATTDETQQANSERILMSLLTGGGRVQMGALMEHLADRLASGQLTDAQMSQIGEARHLARYKALFRQMALFRRLREMARGTGSEITDAGTALWRNSSAGRWEGAMASLDRALVSLRGAGAVSGAISLIERLAGALGSIPPGVAETVGSIGVGLLGIGAVGAGLAGISAFLSTISAAAGGLGVAATAFMSLGGAMRMMLGVGGIALAFSDWKAILDSLTAVGADGTSALGAIGASFGNISTEVANALSGITGLVREITGLVGIEIEGSLLANGLRLIAGLINTMALGIKTVREDFAALRSGGPTQIGTTIGNIGGALDQQSGGLWSDIFGRLGETWTGPRPPPLPEGGTPLYGLGPGGSLLGGNTVDVQGQAQVDLQNEVTVQIEPSAAFAGMIEAARAVISGAARTNVPLNTGQGMPDAGSGGGPPAAQISPPNRM